MAEEANEFLGFFLDEALDVLSVWEKSCLDLERLDSNEAKEELYRSAHNLKSGSGAVGLTAMNELVHKVEDLISRVLGGQQRKSSAIIKVFLSTHSLLVAWIEHLKAGVTFDVDADIQQIYRELSQIQAGIIREPETPDPSEMRASTPEVPFSAAAILLQSIGAIVEAPPTETVHEVKALPAAPPESKLSAPQGKNQESIRVAASKLDQLIQLIGELSTQQAIVWHGRQSGQLQSPSCDNAVQLIQKIAKDLQGLALSLRLQPLQSLFQRLERTACDLARSQEKKMEIALHGEHVEVDRSVIERISDAMNHVIRNAVDHGIEKPEDRLKAGKRESATLRIEAAQETNGVLITISDDGRGLNTERIQEKAIERGIIRSDAKLHPTEVNRLIFLAGFSTAEKVTDISGRGVGMDVVKNAVETIGGAIEVSSQSQVGTSFAISLPATLSIIDALIIAVDGIRYAVPVQDVAEIINTEHSRIEAVAGLGRILSLRSQLIPVEPLRLHLPPRTLRTSQHALDLTKSSPSETMHTALIVRKGGAALVFEVDSILSQQPVTVRSLPPSLSLIPGYIGGTILGDGDPCVILNLSSLVSRHFQRAAHETLAAEAKALSHELADAETPRIESRFLVFETHGLQIAAPLLSIKEVLQNFTCTPMVGAAPHVLGSIEVRGELLPVYELGVLLGLPLQKVEGSMTDLVLEDQTGAFALRVKCVSAVTDVKTMPSTITEKQDKIIPGMRGYLGTGQHRGKPLPLLDLQKCLRLWEEDSGIQNNHQRTSALLSEVS